MNDPMDPNWKMVLRNKARSKRVTQEHEYINFATIGGQQNFFDAFDILDGPQLGAPSTAMEENLELMRLSNMLLQPKPHDRTRAIRMTMNMKRTLNLVACERKCAM